jgi:hypothetical protein
LLYLLAWSCLLPLVSICIPFSCISEATTKLQNRNTITDLVQSTSSCSEPWQRWHWVQSLQNLSSRVVSRESSCWYRRDSSGAQCLHRGVPTSDRTALQPRHVSLRRVNAERAPTRDVTTAFVRVWSPPIIDTQMCQVCYKPVS